MPYQNVNVCGLPFANVALAHAIAWYAMATAGAGATVTAYLKAVITGYEWVEVAR